MVKALSDCLAPPVKKPHRALRLHIAPSALNAPLCMCFWAAATWTLGNKLIRGGILQAVGERMAVVYRS